MESKFPRVFTSYLKSAVLVLAALTVISLCAPARADASSYWDGTLSEEHYGISCT
jgi:hypothetical protein